MAAVQRMSLDHLALVAVKEFAFFGLTGLWQLERWFLAGYHPQGTAQTVD